MMPKHNGKQIKGVAHKNFDVDGCQKLALTIRTFRIKIG